MIQMNQILTNDEAECGLNPNAEDLGKWNTLFNSCSLTYQSLLFKDADAEEDDG